LELKEHSLMKLRTKHVALASIVTAVSALGIARARAQEPYTGSRAADVWAQVASDPYSSLPHESVTLGKFFSWTQNKLKDAAIRTISDESDVLPRFDKLVHPNGICLRGTWNITESSQYTGYFEQGRRGVLIARASVALSDTTAGSFRGFGLAGKLYPTSDPDHVDPLKTASFFVIDDLGGTMATHYMDAQLTNEPALTIHPSEALYLATVGGAAQSAFKAADINPGRRQVYPIAELGVADTSTAVTPRWMMIRGAEGARFDQADFRDELATALKAGPVTMNILVSEDKTSWSTIGFIEFDDGVASDSCDHRLHFHHPKFRTDLP
jgi:hypothetical protein